MTQVACMQIAPRVGDAAYNRELALAALRRAGALGAEVVVLPELATSGYCFSSPDEARSVAIRPDDALLAGWGAAGAAVVVGGFCELCPDGTLANSAAVVGPDGVLAVYRKAHLWDGELLVFTAGAEPPPVVETPVGRIGVCVCYDLEFPETGRALALGGADLICVPTNWPLVARPPGEHPPEVLAAMVTARANHVAIACCDRSGTERGQVWTEGSVIVDAEGWIVASAEGDGVVEAELDLGASAHKAVSRRNDALGDRRPELYGALTEVPPTP